jgi:hypothetical protein
MWCKVKRNRLKPGIKTDIAGLVLIGIVVVWQLLTRKKGKVAV